MMALVLLASIVPISLSANSRFKESTDNSEFKGFTDNSKFKVFTDSSKVFDIDEVVVVSQPKETFRLRQQSLSSTSVSGFQMQNLGTRDLRELSSYIPNFVMPNYGSRLSSAMYVRGIGSRVNSPAVGIYLDGIPVLSKSAFNLHHYQTSRIDVLRGPQATLYGQNAEGGLVRIYSRNPFEYEGTDVRLSYGSRYYRNAEVAHYHRINDQLAFSVAAFDDAQKGFFRNTHTGNRADKYDEAGVKMVLKARLGRGWNVDFLANYQYVDQNGFPYGKLDLETGKAALPSTTFDGTYLRHSLISGITATHDARDFSFASTTSYQYLKDEMNMDQDYLPIDYMSILQEQLQNSITQELTLKSNRPVGGFWNWTVGGFFSYQWLRTNGPVFFNEGMTQPIGNAIQMQMYNAILDAMAQRMIEQGMPEMAAKSAAEKAIEKAGGISLNVDMAAPGLYHTPQWNLGFFHESNFQLTDRMTATLGLRYDLMHTAIHYDACAYMQMNANVMGQLGTYVLDSSLDHDACDNYSQLLPKLGLNLTVDELGSNVYATVSKGYRAGGYNIQMFSDVLQTELNANRKNAMRGDYSVSHTEEDYGRINNTIAYKPETSWNYEAGAHLNLFDNMLHLDLSAYYMKVTNQQLSVMAGNYGFGRMMVNAGKSHSRGLEASMRGQAFDGKLDWALSYGCTRAKFDEYVDGEGEDAVSYAGKYVPYVPQHTMAAMADCHLAKWLTLGANVNAQGKTYWDNANTYSQKMYAVLGAHIDLNFDAIGVSFWGRNLTDSNYNTFAVDNSATGKKEYFAQRGNPFQCGVDVKLHF